MSQKVRGGGPPLTPIMLKLVELLEGGEWVPFEEVAQKAGAVIEPSVALRYTEHRRSLAGGGERVRPMPRDRQIDSGRRALVRATLKAGDYFEYDRPPVASGSQRDLSRRVRMTALPPQVVQYRKMKADGTAVDDEFIDSLMEASDVPVKLAHLSRRGVDKVVVMLIERVKRPAP